jgi:uncharacterized membrane protein
MASSSDEARGEKETQRLEAFSDGVYAIAITLLVLELKVPRALPPGQSVAQALAAQWPVYIAFLVSFGTIGIMWLNHHRLFSMIHRTDNRLLLLNLLLLLMVTLVPFPTFLLAEYFVGDDGRTAAMLYSAHGFNLAVAYNVLWRHAAGNGGRLLDRTVDLKKVAGMTQQYRFGPLLYLISFGLAFWHVWASVLANGALAVFFALSPPDVRKLPEA